MGDPQASVSEQAEIESLNKVPKYIRHAARNAEKSVAVVGYWCHINVIVRVVILVQNSASMKVPFTAGFRQKLRKLHSPNRQRCHEISESFWLLKFSVAFYLYCQYFV